MLSIKIIFLVREMKFFCTFLPFSCVLSLSGSIELSAQVLLSLSGFLSQLLSLLWAPLQSKSNREIVLDSISLLKSSDLLEFATNARIKHMNDFHSFTCWTNDAYNIQSFVEYYFFLYDENTSNDLIDLMRLWGWMHFLYCTVWYVWQYYCCSSIASSR